MNSDHTSAVPIASKREILFITHIHMVGYDDHVLSIGNSNQCASRCCSRLLAADSSVCWTFRLLLGWLLLAVHW
jgi:hypothetical protein